MPTQDRFNKQVKAVTDNCERDILFRAPAVQHKNPLINGDVSRKPDKRVAIGPDEFDLAREAFLARDLAVHPALFPLTPSRQRECFKHRVGGINAGDRPVKIAENLGPASTFAQTMVTLF